MRIAVAGGTGTVGALLLRELTGRGHEVRALSRRSSSFPVDLRTGDGLEHALEECEVVVDAVNSASPFGAAETLVAGSERLLNAERAAGVGHHICISIVGCDRAPMAYYRVKVQQERVCEHGPVPWTIVRATQFHELIAGVFAAGGRWRLLPSVGARLQTVAASDVAASLADVAVGPPLRRRYTVAGPEIVDARELARRWQAVTGRRALRVPVAIPGKLGKALRDGALTAARPDVRGAVTFEEWLRTA
ncbi:MAG TPA: SDR family oxidoreductase [Solirubrobacteraceae bacterium]|nr:SDR family oxidoreductase [Solirubrobacteraceae bacterium]